MTSPGQHTLDEITSQPYAWAEALEVGAGAGSALLELWQRVGGRSLLFTGCGSTHYLSLAAAALARRYGLPARGVPASEIWLGTDPAALEPANTILVAVSRSGETSETLRAVDAFRASGGAAIVAVTCYPERELAAQSNLVLGLPSAREVSIAQTRSFASMLLACQMAVGALAGDAGQSARLATLPELGRGLIGGIFDLMQQMGSDLSVERFFFLGSGPLYGLAAEAMLKMKEMSLTYSEAYHPLEFRHGPMSMADQSALVVGLIGDRAPAQEVAVLRDMRTLGARILPIADDDVSIGADPMALKLLSGLAEDDRTVLYLPPLQLLAYNRSLAKGLDPDRPRNLEAAVVLP